MTLPHLVLRAVAEAKTGRRQDTVMRVVSEQSKYDWPIVSRVIGDCVFGGLLTRHHTTGHDMLCLTTDGRTELARLEAGE